MAIAYINVVHVSRGEGRSAVGASAYAARMCMTDDRTGEVFDYSRKSDDLKASSVYLPKGAPERFRDRSVLWNAAEQAEKRKDARTGRRLIIALPHELTEKQQQQLLTDFIREQFTRKGLAVDMNIHGPDAKGDERNDHAHLLITTRFIDASGLTTKDRESNEKAALVRWQANWEKAVNRQLERYGHAARISFKTPEGQMPQIHLGQAASALERKGVRTRAGDQLREIINDNERLRVVTNDQKRAVGKEFNQSGNGQGRTEGKEFDYAAGKAFAREVITPQRPQAQRTPVQQPQDWTAGKLFARDEIGPPQRTASNDNRPEAKQDYTAGQDFAREATQPPTIERDRKNAAWIEDRRRDLYRTQATERATYDSHRDEMNARHAATWGEAAHRHAVDMAGSTMAETEQAAAWGLSFVLGMGAGLADSVLSIFAPTRRRSKQRTEAEPKKKPETQREREKREQQQRDQHQQEMSAIAEQQAHERESYERRHAAMLQDQQRAREHFEQQYADPSTLQQAWDAADRATARKEARQERERGGPEFEGPELKP